MRAPVDGRLHRRAPEADEGPHGRDQHVAALDDFVHGLRLRDVGDRGLEPAEVRSEGREPLRAAACQHRPLAARNERFRGLAPGVAGRAEDDDPRGHRRQPYVNAGSGVRARVTNGVVRIAVDLERDRLPVAHLPLMRDPLLDRDAAAAPVPRIVRTTIT